MKEWKIYQPEPDKIATSLINNLEGTTEAFQVVQYNRPEIARFTLAAETETGAAVRAGQTIARLYSLEDKLRYAQLAGEFEIAKNQIELLLAGEKPEIREEAQRALEYAKKQKEAFLPQLERRRQLYARELITREELEVTESTFDLYEINERLRKANLSALTTGAKQEEVNVARAKMAALEKQVSILKEILGAHDFIAPISGTIVQGQNPVNLVKVVNTDTMVLVIPVPAEKKIEANRAISFEYGNSSHKSNVVRVNPEIHLINGRSCYLVKAVIENSRKGLTANQRVMVSVPLVRSLTDAVRRQWSNFRYGLGGL